ncbi:YihY/virulence factor BrkB family protein [Polyangium aurulentum]|uniref:YihY/virulence factor BrkB family protein n=1 Tax=Polyangium aurulentum TaxID=2567896 RepID=UPI0010AE1FAB|nr:YihY/virulence factor BrkB family protein [Polyangium aurulentum]UQA55082.1 YihY/virulence factor BrkB family protein [Polyangium aurulentum]
MSSQRPDIRAHATATYGAVGRLVHYLDLHDAPRAASAMAFDAFLSIIPLLAVAGWAMHRLRDDVAHLVASLLRAAPPSVSRALEAEFLRVDDAKALVFAPVGLFAFLWVSSGGAATAIGVFETMFVCEYRPWWKRRLVGVGFIIGSLPAVALATALGLLLASAAGSFLGGLIALMAPLVIVTALVAAFFRLAVRRHRSVRRRIWPGAIATVALWVLVSILFSLYVGSVARYATLYGNLANVAVLLFWLWLVSMALLVGGEINAQLEGVRDPHEGPHAPVATPVPSRPAQSTPRPAPSLRPKRTASSE